MRTHPTVLLFTHKSYIDASLPTLLLYSNDLPMLHTFGGINMDFAGFGTLVRRSGGIFIRRSFQDNPVYKLVLRKYVGYLLEKRFPMSWALEGTRSRLGKLMPPRYGLLKYTLDAAHDAGIEDVHIYPFVTSFDLIRDVDEFVAEQTGRVKKPESFKWFAGYVRSLRRPMGSVRVDLGEPVIVRQAPAPDDKLALAKIAFEVAVQANRVTPLNVTAVMCLVLLGTAPRGATAPELVQLVAVLADWARDRGIRMSDELAADDRVALLANVDRLAASGLLVRYDEGSEVVYAIEPSRHPVASYYRNTIVHHFLDKAILELALFKAEDSASEHSRSGVLGGNGAVARTVQVRILLSAARGVPRRRWSPSSTRVDARWRERLSGDRQDSAPPRATVAAVHRPRRAAAVRRGLCGRHRPAGAARARRDAGTEALRRTRAEGRSPGLPAAADQQRGFDRQDPVRERLPAGGQSRPGGCEHDRIARRPARVAAGAACAVAPHGAACALEALARAEEIMGTKA